MSQRQGPPESEAAATLELLTLRGEISDLTLSESRLRLQIMELRSEITSFERLARPESARHADTAPLASNPPQRLAALQAQLDDAQEQLERLLAQKETLTERQHTAQKRLNTLRARLQSSATWQQSAPPWEGKAPSSQRKRSSRPFVVLLCGLLLIVVLGSLIRIAHFSSLGLSLLSSPSSTETSQPEEQPFFTPAKTAPTNQGCLTTIKDACYSPEYIQQAFGLTPLYKDGYDGKGQTIVLLGAGNVTTLKADLHEFGVAWGLPDPSLTILYPDGPTTPYLCPNGDSLQYQNTLNVEWAHAIAPGAHIVLLIGSNNKSSGQPQENCAQTSTQQDIAFALNNSLGNIISVSAGSREVGQIGDKAAQKTAEQKYFAAGHQLLQQAANAHVTVLAAAGDSGATTLNDSSTPPTYWPTHNVSWPASDPGVLAVGGTVLTLGNNVDDDAYIGETAWNNPNEGATGGGLSAVFPEPDYQMLVPDQTLFQGQRGIPDVAFPAANLLIYQSAQDGALIKANPQWKHWDTADGTSLAASCWAGMIAIANQMYGQPLGFIQPALYRVQGQGMHDITTGNNSFANVPGYQAQKGFDLVSGWGTPVASIFLPALIEAANPPHSACDTHSHKCA
jgi:subtilase family serine protease